MRDFIQHLSEASWSSLGEQAIDASKKVILDTVGAIIAGTNEHSTQQLMEQLKGHSNGDYTVIGADATFNLHTAGLINGTATVAIEQDEGNQWSKGHPAAHIVPTMLTYVQTKERYTGKEFILELVKAYEACSRFGRATTLLPDAHAHGTWGVMGAAVGVLLLENVPPEKLYEGINISASFAMPTMWSSALSGSLIRNIYVGQAVESGIKTIELLNAGFLAPKDSVAYIYGNVLGKEFNLNKLNESFDKWEVEKNYYKDHAFCRYAHAPLDAFKKIVMENQLEARDIKKIHVWTYKRAATLKSSEYHNALSAKFSIPYALSSWIHTNKSDHSIFDGKYLNADNIRNLARNVQVFASEELEKDYPTIMAAEVEVTLHSGAVYKQRLDNAATELGENVSFQMLVNKFKLNTSHLSRERQEAIIDWVLHMDQKEDMKEFISLLCMEGT